MAAGLRCGSATIKYLLFLFNFLFSLCGLAIVIVGALCATALKSTGDGTLKGSVIFILVVGSIIFVIAFLGCCGAIRESHFMLVSFAILLMVIIVCQVIAAVLLFLNVTDIEKPLQDLFKNAQDGGPGSDAMDAVNDVQLSFQCCGTKDPNFWKPLPSSCCADSPVTCETKNAFSKGCIPLIKEYIGKYGKALGAVAIVVALVELIGVWFSLALAGEIKNLSR